MDGSVHVHINRISIEPVAGPLETDMLVLARLHSSLLHPSALQLH